MNARETFQALLDGETIIGSNGYLWRLDDCDDLVQRRSVMEKWKETYIIFNGDCEIYKECTLTYKEAHFEMLKGKTVKCEMDERYAYRLHDDRFESAYYDDDFTEWSPCEISVFMRAVKWKVVE